MIDARSTLARLFVALGSFGFALAAPGAALGVERELVRESFTLDHLSSDWEVLLPVPDDVYPSAGQLRVMPAVAPDWGAHSRLPNLVRFRLPLSASEIEVRTRVELAIDSPGHGAALVLYQDDRNFVEVAFRGEQIEGELRRVLRLTRVVGGEEASVARRHGRGPAVAPEAVELVLERRGDLFSARM